MHTYNMYIIIIFTNKLVNIGFQSKLSVISPRLSQLVLSFKFFNYLWLEKIRDECF